jgi:hypothetical protein
LQVRFGPGDLAHAGYTQDVSESGIYLQAGIIYPPNTVLVLQIEYPDGALTVRAVVRWARDLPPAFKRSLRGGMGLEFVDAVAARAAVAPQPEAAPPARPRKKGIPSEAAEYELEALPTRRRQVSTMAGNTFEVRETERGGAIYIRIFQLPLTDGSHEAAFREAFWTRQEADTAVRAFLKSR